MRDRFCRLKIGIFTEIQRVFVVLDFRTDLFVTIIFTTKFLLQISAFSPRSKQKRNFQLFLKINKIIFILA